MIKINLRANFWDHGSASAHELLKWIETNQVIDWSYVMTSTETEYTGGAISFKNEEDAIAFKIRFIP